MPPGPENPYPISDQNIRFSIPYFRPHSQNVYPISDPWRCGNFSNSQWIYGVRDFVMPQTMFAVFFFFAFNVHGNTRYSKDLSQTKQTPPTHTHTHTHRVIRSPKASCYVELSAVRGPEDFARNSTDEC